MADLPDVDLELLTAIASGTHHDPHTVLGPHLLDGPWAVVRALRPLADVHFFPTRRSSDHRKSVV